MQSNQMIKARVAALSKSTGMKLSAEIQADDRLVLYHDGQEVFGTTEHEDFWNMVSGYHLGLKSAIDRHPITNVTVRWIRNPLEVDGGWIVGWASCTAGPIYLNNMMLVQLWNEDIEVRWPQMKNQPHHWWEPSTEFGKRLSAAVLESVLGQGVI